MCLFLSAVFLPGGSHKTEKVHLFPFNGLYLVDIYLTGARFVSHTHLLYKSKCFHRPTFCHSTLLSCCLGASRCVNFKNYISFLFSALQNIISSCEPEGVSEIQHRKKTKNSWIKIRFCTSHENSTAHFFFLTLSKPCDICFCHLALIKWVTKALMFCQTPNGFSGFDRRHLFPLVFLFLCCTLPGVNYEFQTLHPPKKAFNMVTCNTN